MGTYLTQSLLRHIANSRLHRRPKPIDRQITKAALNDIVTLIVLLKVLSKPLLLSTRSRAEHIVSTSCRLSTLRSTDLCNLI